MSAIHLEGNAEARPPVGVPVAGWGEAAEFMRPSVNVDWGRDDRFSARRQDPTVAGHGEGTREGRDKGRFG
ncbi:hypothetical protein GCM10025780_30760 [Frondihabitans cladoniiphilus]|uniref:Uncharacterized protein n=1 Tax=Frondihabitans cladoniiphilus TaxID=715785 RepID=A0ABP8W9M9_9MICO